MFLTSGNEKMRKNQETFIIEFDTCSGGGWERHNGSTESTAGEEKDKI